MFEIFFILFLLFEVEYNRNGQGNSRSYQGNYGNKHGQFTGLFQFGHPHFQGTNLNRFHNLVLS